MRLIKPIEKYFDEFLAACNESIDNDVTEWMPLQKDELDTWKDSALKRYEMLETGEGLPEGIPKMVTYWCIENDKFIGEIQIRPYITEEQAKAMGHIGYAVRYSMWGKGYGNKILASAIEKLKELDVQTIYIACHTDNIGSNKLAVKNGFKYVENIVNEIGEEQNVYILKQV